MGYTFRFNAPAIKYFRITIGKVMVADIRITLCHVYVYVSSFALCCSGIYLPIGTTTISTLLTLFEASRCHLMGIFISLVKPQLSFP